MKFFRQFLKATEFIFASFCSFYNDAKKEWSKLYCCKYCGSVSMRREVKKVDMQTTHLLGTRVTLADRELELACEECSGKYQSSDHYVTVDVDL